MQGTRKAQIDHLDEDMKKFSQRYEDFRREKEESLMKAIERDTEKEDQEPSQTQACSSCGLDRFTSYPDLKSKYLEKDYGKNKVITKYIKE